MKTLMPGFCKQSCTLVLSACLLVSTAPLPANADDNLSAPGKPLGRHMSSHVPTRAKLLNLSQGSKSVTFVENKGQFDNQVKFQASGSGRTLWLTSTSIVFDFQQSVAGTSSTSDAISPASETSSSNRAQIFSRDVRKPINSANKRQVIDLDFVGANKSPIIQTRGTQPGVRNYLYGNDPAKWQTQVSGFSEVVYRNVWDGIDLRLYGNGPDLEQEFIVNPGANADQMRLGYRGIDKLEAGKDGSLFVCAAAGRMRETRPRIYQELGGRRVPIKGRFKLLSSTSYTFEIAAYDRRQPLVIDPTLLFSTFLGGSAGNTREAATSIAVDQAGNAYVTGFTQSPDFPTTPGAFQQSFGGGQQTFVSKMNPAGSGLVFSTYLNGMNGASPNAIAVDSQDNVYVAGNVNFFGNAGGAGFPTTSNAFSQSCNGTAFLSVLNQTGSGLLYSTCFGFVVPNVGGAPLVTSMAVDSTGRAFVAGTVSSGSTLPTTPNAYQPTYPGSLAAAFVTEFDPTLSGSRL